MKEQWSICIDSKAMMWSDGKKHGRHALNIIHWLTLDRFAPIISAWTSHSLLRAQRTVFQWWSLPPVRSRRRTIRQNRSDLAWSSTFNDFFFSRTWCGDVRIFGSAVSETSSAKHRKCAAVPMLITIDVDDFIATYWHSLGVAHRG